MGPVLNPVTGVFRGREGGVMTETGIIAMWPRAQERLPGAPEAARGTKRPFLEPLEGVRLCPHLASDSRPPEVREGGDSSLTPTSL